MKIAIIENEFITQLHLQRLVEQMGYQVAGFAPNYEEAVNLIEDKNPDIFLLDICLDGKHTGIDLANYINNRGDGNIIYITGNFDKKSKESIMNTKYLGVIEKPFESEQFKEKLMSFIELKV